MKEKIVYRDGEESELIFQYSSINNSTVICLPAMGVRASYYTPFAEALSKSNINVVLSDYRGTGSFNRRASRKVDFGYEDLVLDLDEVLDRILAKWPDTNLYLMGHSLGGHVATMYQARYTKRIRGLILIACPLPFYKGWKSGLEQLKIKLVGLSFPSISRLFGYLPGQSIGFGGKEARTLIKDWSLLIIKGKFKITNSDFNYEQGIKLSQPQIISISLEGDSLAPKASRDNLLLKFSNKAPIEKHHLYPEETGIKRHTHFNWVKTPKSIVNHISLWLEKLSSA